MTEYIGSKLKNDIVINRLYSVHYFEYSDDFKFVGEKHDFWEFVYVDRGEVIVLSDDTEYLLKQGEVIFHKPGEWHNICSNGTDAANVAIVSFGCSSKAMSFFENRIMKTGQLQKNIISKIISEYINAFSTPLNHIYSYSLTKRQNPPVGSEQLLLLYICEFLISLLRNDPSAERHSTISINHSNSMLNLLLNYMQSNLTRNITIDDLVRYSGSNRTSISQLFKENFGMGAIKYFISLKTEAAKKYLREGSYNVTQISELLGYSGIHYFSRRFKAETGMSPAEYANSIKAMTKI